MFEVRKRDQHDCHVVQGSPQQRVLQDVLDAQPAHFVDVVRSQVVRSVVLDALPDALDAVLVAQLVENAIACQHDEVVVLRDLELLDLGRRNHHVRIASKFLDFGLDVAEGPRDGEAAGQHAQRPHNRFLRLRLC